MKPCNYFFEKRHAGPHLQAQFPQAVQICLWGFRTSISCWGGERDCCFQGRDGGLHHSCQHGCLLRGSLAFWPFVWFELWIQFFLLHEQIMSNTRQHALLCCILSSTIFSLPEGQSILAYALSRNQMHRRIVAEGEWAGRVGRCMPSHVRRPFFPSSYTPYTHIFRIPHVFNCNFVPVAFTNI